MITVIHILSDANISGAPIQVLSLIDNLPTDQFAQVVITPAGPFTEELHRRAIPTETVQVYSKLNLAAITATRQAITGLAKTTPNSKVLIHCHGVRAGLFGRLAARTLPYPVIYTEHSWTRDYHLPSKLNEFFQFSVLRWLDRYTSKTVAVSEAVADFLISAKITVPAKIATIHNCVSIPQHSVIPSSCPIMGSVGSLTWQKNYGWLLDCMPTILTALPDAKLQIIGEGIQRQELEAKIAALNLSESVTLLGSIPHDALPQHYKDWCLYVQPSTNESFGLAMAEAVGAGLPALATNTGSSPEILGNQGASLKLDDQDHSAKVLIDFLSDREKRAQLCKEEQQHLQKFSVAKMVEGYTELYRELGR